MSNPGTLMYDGKERLNLEAIDQYPIEHSLFNLPCRPKYYYQDCDSGGKTCDDQNEVENLALQRSQPCRLHRGQFRDTTAAS